MPTNSRASGTPAPPPRHPAVLPAFALLALVQRRINPSGV
jgi:MYXO-CTERM domain-containing protein